MPTQDNRWDYLAAPAYEASAEQNAVLPGGSGVPQEQALVRWLILGLVAAFGVAALSAGFHYL